MADATGHSMDESIFWAFIKDWWGFAEFLAGAAGPDYHTFPCVITRVNATGTTATGIHAYLI